VTRVVVADDETIVRADVRATLERAGFDVCGEAADGSRAVALARAHRPDLVVIDAGMPSLDGVEASRQILAELDVPIVMLTGYSYGDLISRALEAGVAAYVVKPFAEEALLEAVAASLRIGRRRETLAYLRRARG
jgi:two-component system, response regulator PdtaR